MTRSLNTTSKGEVGLDYDITTLYMENPGTAGAFLQRFGRAGRASEATVHVYGLGQGPWGDDADFPTFAQQIYDGLEGTQMDPDWLADLTGFRGAYALAARENSPGWFNQELREDFSTNVDQYSRWRGFIATIENEIDEISTGFEAGKYTDNSDEAKLLRFTKRCFKGFRGLRGRSLPAAVKYPRGDRIGLTTYDLTSTLRHYDIDHVEDETDTVLVLAPSDEDARSVVTARLPEYETHPTKYNRPTRQIEEEFQRKIHRTIDQVALNDAFETSTELLHRFFRIICITDAIVPERITTAGYDIEVDTETNGPPTIDVQQRHI
jgi:CRISPR-associated endonuclease/helicase Cas3